MKIKNLVFTFLALIAVTLSACSNDDNNSSSSNSYTYGDEKIDIKWAGYYTDNDFYSFSIASEAPMDEAYKLDKIFNFNLSKDKLGVRCDIKDEQGDYFWGSLKSGGVYYYFQDNDDIHDDVTGTNNWIKVTKNSGDNNFTLEFEMTMNNKPFKGKYSGTFIKYSNYSEVGLGI